MFLVSAQLSGGSKCIVALKSSFVKARKWVIIAIHILGKLFCFTSERAGYQYVIGNLFTREMFPERSRYNCCCRLLRFSVK
ncbi:putative transposase [Geobacillus sp. GHH01]|nr:putative transposase [Geobacillus sp. GHH01]